MVSTVKLAELWQRKGYRVVVLCMGRNGMDNGKLKIENGFSKEVMSETLTIYRVPDVFVPDPWNYGIAFGFSGIAMRLALEIRPDVIVVNKVLFWSSIALLRLRLAGHPVLLITDALVGITWWPRGRLAQVCAAIYAWTLGWLILRFATKIVFFHPQPAPVLSRLGIAAKSTVIPTGIDVAGQQVEPRLDAHSVRVTYTGRLESVKGVDDFLAAASRVKKDHPELLIRVVGWHTPDHPLVKEHAHEVEFTGLRNDIPALLAETDMFVLPSYSEGLSNSLMEAMRAGCACIASDVGGNRYLIENGVSGLLFGAGDRAALASHIERLLADTTKRRTLGEAARKRIQSIFSWERVGQMYDELFQSWTA